MGSQGVGARAPEERAIFRACNGSPQPGLWVTDGSSAGTRPLVDPGGETADFAEVGSYAVFRGPPAGGGSGWRTWVSDGTTAGTVEVGPWYARLNPVGSLACAVALDAEGRWFWRFDPATGEYTRLGAAPYLDVQRASDRHLAWFGNGSEWWRCDGTLEGTRRVGQTPSDRAWRRAAVSSRGVWVDDQGEDGIQRLGHLDATTGEFREFILGPREQNDRAGWGLVELPWGVIFTRADAEHGREPWALPLAPLLFTDGFESGDTSQWSAHST